MKLDNIATLISHGNTNFPQDIKGLAYKLSDVQPDFAFFSKSGDPLQIEEAIKKGASAIIGAKPINSATPFLTTPNTEKAQALIAHYFYQKPSHNLTTTGIIGTTGKSTLSQLIQQIEQRLGTKSIYLPRTKIPTSLEIHKLLANSYENQVKNAIIEICLSHITDNHLDHTRFTTLIHTTTNQALTNNDKWNLTTPFIRLTKDQNAIINLDDDLAADLQHLTIAKVTTYGTMTGAHIQAQNISLTLHHTTFDLYHKGNFICQVKTPLLGLYNVYNTLALLAYFTVAGYQLEVVVNLLKDISSIGGRLEKISNHTNFNVLVDHAETVCALESVLKTLVLTTKGKVIALLPAKGNGQRSHLSQIGKVVLANSAHVIFTGEPTPRDDAHHAIYDMLKGTIRNNYTIVIDPEKAIEKALKMAKAGDTIVLLGKADDHNPGISHKRIAQYTLEKLQR